MNSEAERLQEKCLSSQLIFDGKVIHLYVDNIQLPNGGVSQREYIRHNGAVAVLPLNDDGEVICVRQYRYAVGQVFFGIAQTQTQFLLARMFAGAFCGGTGERPV